MTEDGERPGPLESNVIDFAKKKRELRPEPGKPRRDPLSESVQPRKPQQVRETARTHTETPQTPPEDPHTSPELNRYRKALRAQQAQRETERTARENEEQARMEEEREKESRLESLIQNLPFSFEPGIRDRGIDEALSRLSTLQSAYGEAVYRWIFQSPFITSAKGAISNGPPSYALEKVEDGRAALQLNIPLSSNREELVRLINTAGKAVETACVSKKNAHLKVIALTNFLIDAYDIKIHHSLDDVRGRKAMLIAQCLDNIHKALRMLTPEELNRVHELSFSTPEDPMLLWQVIRMGKKVGELLHLNDIDEYADIDPGFYTSPRTIVRDIRTYFRKSNV